MKRCNNCSADNPANARFCMQCGEPMQEIEQPLPPELKSGGLSMFALSLLGSLLISLVLVFVFGLPVFFLAGFLPLFWLRRKK